jgi:hypothetical protein
MKTFNAIDNITSVFSGQSDVVVGVENPTYESATIDDLFGEGARSLGQIVEDSTSWDGDDPEMTPIKDEQGDTITTQITAGTLAFSLEIASTSTNMLKAFMKAEEIEDFTSTVFGSAKATGFGVELPVVTRPILIANDEGNKALVFPKAKIVGNLAYSDKLWRVRIAVTAEWIDTQSLKTGMLLEGITNAA